MRSPPPCNCVTASRNASAVAVGLSELIRQQDSKPTWSKSSAALVNRSPNPLPRCGIKSKCDGNIPSYSFSLRAGVKTPTPWERSPAAEITAAISRKKQVFSSAASEGVSGGCNLVFTVPARGALVMIASAKRGAATKHLPPELSTRNISPTARSRSDKIVNRREVTNWLNELSGCGRLRTSPHAKAQLCKAFSVALSRAYFTSSLELSTPRTEIL